MINCLENSVDLTLCGERDPSVFYLDNMPGISVKSVDASASDIQQTFIGVMNSVRAAASQKLLSDLRLSSEQWTCKVLATDVAGFYGDGDYPAALNSVGWRGVSIQSFASKYSGLYVKNIQFLAREAGTLTIYVYDLSLGQVVDVINMAVVPGYNAIAVNKSYAVAGTTRRLGFVYDSSLFTPTLTPLYQGCNCTVGANCGCGFLCGQYRTTGVDTSDSVPLASNIVESNFAYGLRIEFEIKCMAEMFICANMETFRYAYINLMCMLLLKNLLHSDRQNRFTLIGTDKKEELIAYYEKEYANIMAGVAEYVFAGDGCCYECIPVMRHTYKHLGGGCYPFGLGY